MRAAWELCRVVLVVGWLGTGWARGEGGEVHVRLFHTDCPECRRVKRVIEDVKGRYGDRVVVHEYDFLREKKNYALMVRLENALGVRANEPVAVYVGTNYLYGVKAIEEGFEGLVRAGLGAGGVGLWEPREAGEPAATGEKDEVRERFRGFSVALVAVAGFLDGLNPCAFATLVLFVTLLSCYRANWRDVLVCTGLFAGAVFLTYFWLGVGLAEGLRFIERVRAGGVVLHWLVVGLCVVFGAVSVRDAWVVWQRGEAREAVLGLPASWREKIARLLGEHVGRRRWLVGVFGVGVVVALLESVCTGQVYVPTLTYMLRVSEVRHEAALLLVLYNFSFIVPLLALGGGLALGLRSQWVVEWQKRHGVLTRVLMAGLFMTLAAVLVVTGK